MEGLGLFNIEDPGSRRGVASLLNTAEAMGPRVLESAVQVAEADSQAFLMGAEKGAQYAGWAVADAPDHGKSVLRWAHFDDNLILPKGKNLDFPAYAVGFILGEAENRRRLEQ